MNGRLLALAWALAAGEASACSYIVQTQLSFEGSSAALDRSQVIKLAQWLDRSYANFSMYTRASIEVGASDAVPHRAKALAEQRAANAARALRILLKTELPITTVARGHRSPLNGLGDSNDFASLQLYPDVEGLKLPDCNPVPIPGFKPCQRIIQITLAFADGSAELDRAQLNRLAEWVDRADAMYAIYESAGVEAGATVKVPGRTSEDAMRLARMRADNTTHALKGLFPVPIGVEQFAHSYRERKDAGLVVNDFAAIQLYPNLKTSKLPGCNPGRPDGLER
ncbi:hypothetical protein [Variovorax guangxiensis]|uniref:Nitrous oxide reductase accessory protein NosL n=1 Tax=Variovorax guangxiensis TaxID=1775474 RepID=A0A840FD56_9BURK|nr:hypothetical protein [Variovorax guangxiensis]MBB4219473.1 nitrous oxide reductase accessory protein NosL [Variovorax guangxiensis]